MENSKEPDLKVSRPVKDLQPASKINRRKFIKDSLLGVLGFAVGARLGFNPSEPSASPQAFPEPSQKLPDIAFKQPINEVPDLDAYRNAIKKDESFISKQEVTVSEMVDELFPKYTNEEKEVMNRKIETAVSYFRNQRYPNDSELKDVIKKSLQWKDLIKEEIKEMKLSEEFLKSGIPDLIPSLIFVESEGEPSAYNEISGATGLAQVMPKTAEELAQKLGMKNYDLRDARTSIRFALKYLSDWYEYVPEVGLSLWNYHLGPGNLLDIVRAKVGDWNVGFDTLANVISVNHLNLANLVESPFTKEQIANGILGDMTEEYATRIIAANYFQKQYSTEKTKRS